MKPKPFSLLNHFTVPCAMPVSSPLMCRAATRLGSVVLVLTAPRANPSQEAPVSPLDGPRRVQGRPASVTLELPRHLARR